MASRPRISKPYKDGRNFSDSKLNRKSEGSGDRSFNPKAKENRKPRSFSDNDSADGSFAPRGGQQKFRGDRSAGPNRNFNRSRNANSEGNSGNFNKFRSRDGEGNNNPRFEDKGGYRKPTRSFNNEGDDQQQPRSFDRNKRFGAKKEFGNKRFGNDRGGYKPKRDYNNDSNDLGGTENRSTERPNRYGDKKEFGSNRGGFRNNNDSERSSFGRDRRSGGGYGSNQKFNKPRGKDFSKPKKRVAEETDGLIRLNKYIANSGICSRREADKLIEDGLISVNGTVITELGVRVAIADDVRYGGERINPERPVYILLNKPKDVITSTKDPEGRLTVIDIVKKACKERVYPVGRLDRNTTGVLLLTNDGAMAKKLTHPSSNISKMYQVSTDKAVLPEHLEQLLQGVELEDGFMKVDAIEYVEGSDNKREIGLQIHSGKNRIVRRMFEHLGYEVEKLDRVLFAGLTKKTLPRGRYRFLDEKEIGMLKMLRTGK